MSEFISRDKPELIKVEFDNKPSDIKDFFTKEDNYYFRSFEEVYVVFDFDDPSIMMQYKEDKYETYIMNLLYAREKLKYLYDMWFQQRSKHKMK